MTRRLRGLDRVLVLVVGAGMVALGLLGLDWHYAWLGDRPDTLDTSAAGDVVATAWWPWAGAAGGVGLGVVGLAWLLAHLRRPGTASRRLADTDATGLLEADLRSVAAAAADRYAALAPVVGMRGSTRTIGSRAVIVLSGHVDPYADADALVEAATTCAVDLEAAFPGEGLTCRVVLDAPRRPRSGRSTRVRVR